MEAGGAHRVVRAGDIVVNPPGVKHHTTPRDDLECIYIQADLRNVFTITAPTVISDNETHDGLALADMIFRSRFELEFAGALIGALSRFILKHMTSDDALTTAVRHTIDKIGNRFHDCHLNLAELLRESGYAEDYIRAGFKRTVGKTPTALLTEMRIRHACYLIDIYHGTLTLSEIANLCGYTDYVQFSKRFKEIMGVSPRTYKNNL